MCSRGFVCLNTDSPAGGPIGESFWALRTWALAEGSILLCLVWSMLFASWSCAHLHSHEP